LSNSGQRKNPKKRQFILSIEDSLENSIEVNQDKENLPPEILVENLKTKKPSTTFAYRGGGGGGLNQNFWYSTL